MWWCLLVKGGWAGEERAARLTLAVRVSGWKGSAKERLACCNVLWEAQVDSPRRKASAMARLYGKEVLLEEAHVKPAYHPNKGFLRNRRSIGGHGQ